MSPPNNPSMTGYAADGSGYYISVTNYTDATIFDSNGNEVYPVVTDRSGNYFSNDSNGNLIDTLGRTPVVVTPNGSQTFYDVLTVGGTTKRYTVTTETIDVNTAFGQSGVNEYSGTLTAIQSITLPDGVPILSTTIQARHPATTENSKVLPCQLEVLSASPTTTISIPIRMRTAGCRRTRGVTETTRFHHPWLRSAQVLVKSDARRRSPSQTGTEIRLRISSS